MKEAKQLLEKQIKKLNTKIKEIQVILENSSPGKLIITNDNNHNRFYKSSNGSRKYLNKNDIKIISSLAQKEYLFRLQKILIKNITMIKKALSLIESVDIGQEVELVYNKLPQEIRNFVEKNDLDNNFAKRWQSIKYKRKAVSEQIPFYTEKNEHVRSKSEIIIANALNKREIPYHYECKLELGGITLHPDFTILNKRTREIYIWEHFGMMDNIEYSSTVLEKIECYALNNYYVGKNLIITYESSEASLNTKIIENLINKFLL